MVKSLLKLTQPFIHNEPFSFSAAYFRGKQLCKHRLMAFNINPITSILYWCKAVSKRVIFNGIIQL